MRRIIARAARETALAQPGTAVCRLMTAGIGNQEWIRGSVVGHESGRLAVRIVDPGLLQHTIAGVSVVKGTTVRDDLEAWSPCG